MPVKELSLVDSVIQSLSLTGLWQGDNGHKPVKLIIAKFAILSYLGMYVLQAIALVLAKDDFERLFECFSVISFSGMGILKLYSLVWKRKHWLRLFDNITQLEQYQLIRETVKISDDDENPANVETYTAKFKKVSVMLQRIYFFTCVIFILTPFIEYGLYWIFESRPKEYPHILPGWNPLQNSGVNYVAMVMLEAVAAAYCVTTHVAFDSAAIGVVIFVCGQFALLKTQCMMIGTGGNSLLLSRQRDKTAHFEIAKCHNTHLFLVKVLKDLDMLLVHILGVYIVLASLTLCTVAVRLTLEELSVIQLLSLLQYMCGTLVQLFLFCSYGNAVYYESSIGPGEGPFCCAVWRLGPKIRRELAMLAFGMMVPRELHAGPFNTLNLPTFIQIVRAAYSYYAVIGKK